MFYNRYKFQRNNGLLPKIQQSKPESLITSYCLLNQQKQKQYNLQRNPLNKNMLIMFNDKQYLHRQCSFLTESKDSTDIIKSIAHLYPKHQQTLTIFVANQPSQCDHMILGLQSNESLLMKAYKHLVQNKQKDSSIKLSIIGIENENSLTDELNFQWLDMARQSDEQTPLKAIIKNKHKLKIIKDQENNLFLTQNLSRHEIESQKKLNEILKRYQDTKSHFQKWILSTQYTQYYLLGQLYHLAEIQESPEKDGAEFHRKNHYILRVNQYIRTSSPLMLRLGMNLRRIEDQNYKLLQMHESKLFKLLSECFVNKYAKNSKRYHYHLFLQVGEYLTLKEQYLCLVPMSQFLTRNQIISSSHLDSPFFFTKQLMEYPQLHNIINSLINGSFSKQNDSVLPQISQMVKERLKTKSYVCDTYSSQEKRIIKHHHIATEQNDHHNLDLEEIVNEAAKIYRLPSSSKNPVSISKESSLIMKRKMPKYAKYARISFLQKQPDDFNNERQTIFQKRKKESNNESKKLSKRQLSKNKFYENTKEWLGMVYGKNSSKKLFSAGKKLKKFDETTNAIIRDMLYKEMNYAQKEEIDDMIDHFS